MSEMKIEMLADEQALVGEGPVWEPENQRALLDRYPRWALLQVRSCNQRERDYPQRHLRRWRGGKQEWRLDVWDLGGRDALAV